MSKKFGIKEDEIIEEGSDILVKIQDQNIQEKSLLNKKYLLKILFLNKN
jgi:hypothetical protein